jgi:LCP family protein required for cell wall assembly
MNVSIDINNKDLGVKKDKRNNPSTPPINTKVKQDITRKKKVRKERIPLKVKNPKLFKTLKVLLISILTLSIGFGAYSGYKAYNFANNIGLDVGIGDIVNPIVKDPELQKDSTGQYTNVLLLGIDTRDNEAGLLNTDTMIVASYNHETNDAVLISVPRDFFVMVPNEGWYTKINGIYSHGEKREEGSGVLLLRTVLEEVLDMEIQYHAMIDLNGFTQTIDALGGLTINVENTFTDYQYPTGLPAPYNPFETVTFEAGPQTMDGDTALKYSRSRKSPDPFEGSDFARARRQQNVIVALQEKLLSTETLLDPTKLLEILDLVEENVQLSEFTLEDIQAGLALLNKQEENNGEIYTFVLDPTIGDWQVLTDRGLTTDGAYVIGPKLGLSVYTDLHSIVQGFLGNPELYKEEATIMVYDTGLGYYPTYDKTLELLEEFPFTDITFMGTLYYDKTGVTMYNHSQDKFPTTTTLLSDYISPDSTIQPEYITTSLNAEDITILFGAEIVEEVTEQEVIE